MVQRTDSMQDTQISYQTKQVKYLLYFTAVCLSIVSAYYSIAGLAAIFAAAVIPIIVMGGVLEFAKLVVASWLYRSWKDVPLLMRGYFSFALVILMLLTSMGIFGFLSKAHLDQAVPTGDVASKIALFDEKLKTEKENINAARAQLKQLDTQVDQTIGRSEDSKGVERSLQIRRGQQKERTTLLAEIGSAQTRIARLNEERAPIAAELRKVEAEVGPIKYIAALIYGDNPDNNILEKAVRVVIIMIVLVFDPLAVLLLMAANMPIRKEETHHDSETTSKEDSSEGSTSENPSKENFTEKANAIKERFFRKFSSKTSPSLVEQTTEVGDTRAEGFGIKRTDSQHSSSGSSGTTSSGSEEISVPEVKEPDWTISNPPKVIEFDSAGRRITPTFEGESVGVKTIEKEVEELQDKKPK
jgi:hypothetical protein